MAANPTENQADATDWEYDVSPGSELDRRLADLAESGPDVHGIIYGARGRRFVIAEDTDPAYIAFRDESRRRAANPVPLADQLPFDWERFNEALQKIGEFYTEEEAESRIEEIYRWRQEGSRP